MYSTVLHFPICTLVMTRATLIHTHARAHTPPSPPLCASRCRIQKASLVSRSTPRIPTVVVAVGCATLYLVARALSVYASRHARLCSCFSRWLPNASCTPIIIQNSLRQPHAHRSTRVVLLQGLRDAHHARRQSVLTATQSSPFSGFPYARISRRAHAQRPQRLQIS